MIRLWRSYNVFLLQLWMQEVLLLCWQPFNIEVQAIGMQKTASYFFRLHNQNVDVHMMFSMFLYIPSMLF